MKVLNKHSWRTNREWGLYTYLLDGKSAYEIISGFLDFFVDKFSDVIEQFMTGFRSLGSSSTPVGPNSVTAGKVGKILDRRPQDAVYNLGR